MLGMRIGTSKSEAIVLCKKPFPTLWAGGERLPQVREFKYLETLCWEGWAWDGQQDWSAVRSTVDSGPNCHVKRELKLPNEKRPQDRFYILSGLELLGRKMTGITGKWHGIGYLLKFQIMIVANLCFLFPSDFLFPDKVFPQTYADRRCMFLN